MNQLLNETTKRMEAACERLSGEYASIQAGRANASVLDKIRVDYYGTPTPINQMAAVSVSEARILVIQPWDISLLSAIEKEIQKLTDKYIESVEKILADKEKELTTM